ncbi:LysR substrate-binding domain-containing protein [Rhodopila sp.]|uniref:LysR substrate-binding domain-containing protein n=1 Tax=Rhodopila sp. TaxID=2480087 RepID=UPI002C7E1730|nr:LysR substrate-binding domain-containing protein [Rhodopila sp.]HVZ06475.1 LysR substrate-binding domain-containing protein [Rhodopila sp.]
MPGRRLPPLYAIRAFEAAARHRSMTGAANELHVTPGAISRHVRGLEQQMETPLFLRRATGLELTSAGDMLARSVGEALDRIAEATSGARMTRYRHLTVGVYSHFASRFLLPRWKTLRAAHPDLEIGLHTSANPLDLLPEHHDAVIAVADGSDQPGMRTHRLMPISTVPVCAPGLISDGGPDFATIPMLHARLRPEDWRRWLSHAGMGNVPVRNAGSYESLGLTLEAAAAGLGYAIGIEALLRPDLERGTVVVAHQVSRPTRRFFVLLYETRLADDPATQAFADWIMGQVEGI